MPSKAGSARQPHILNPPIPTQRIYSPAVAQSPPGFGVRLPSLEQPGKFIRQPDDIDDFVLLDSLCVPSHPLQLFEAIMSTTEELPHPRVGVAAIIRNPSNADQLLVGRRLGSHGKGHWQFPGGHLEYGEAFNGCAERETLEETGLNVEAKGLVAVTNGVFVLERKHYITLFVACKMIDVGAVPEVGINDSFLL